MSLRQSYRLLVLTVLLSATSLFTGCASFRGDQLPERSKADLAAPASKQPASFQLSWKSMGRNAPAVANAIAPLVREVLTTSELFSEVSSGSTQAARHFDITIENTGNQGVAMLTGFFSGLTFTILPGYAKDEYTMRVAVHKAGKIVKEYTYKDHMTTWIQMFMIFFPSFNSAEEVCNDLLENMCWNLMYDLQKEAVLQSP